MYAFVFVLVAILAGPSCANPVGFDLYSDYTSDYYDNNYEPPLASDLLKSPFSFSQFPNVISPNYLSSAPVVGAELLSAVSDDLGYNYRYATPRIANFGKTNYLRDYSFDTTEVGVRDQVLVKSNVPFILPPNYLTSSVIIGSDLQSTFPADFPNSYQFDLPRIANFAKENYVRDYGYGTTEAGIRNQISVRSDSPILPPYTKAWSFLPIGKCIRGINKFNQRSTSLLPFDYDVAF